jgi:acetylornithine deacetylase/succinyl-diaminopimelate desuccinylase-like protein
VDLAPVRAGRRRDRILARGAADDKGQVHAHVMAAGAVMATRGSFPINVKYVFEGEEESSTEHLDHWLETARDKLAADVAIISDTGFFEGNRPAITLSLRGLMYAQIDVVGTCGRPPLRGLRRRRAEPGERPGGDHRRAQGPTDGSASRLLR